jgi:DNA-binding transcriptional ArsR family regulator
LALADSLPITRQAVSKHLAVLTRVGLLEGEKSGREMRYRLNVEHLDRATKSLGELAEAWDQRLLRIKSIAEATRAKSKS